MTSVGQLWRTLNRRVGKVQQAVVLGLLATAITVPIAVAGPQGSANLQTTPTTTSSTATTTHPATVSTTTSSATTTSVSSTTASTSRGTSTVVVTAPAGGSFTLGSGNNPQLSGLGLTVGTHTVTAVTPSGAMITGTITVNANGTITVSPNLQGVPLKSLSIVLGATATAPSQVPAQVPAQAPAQVPAQTPSGAPGQLPAQLPHTGAGGGAL